MDKKENALSKLASLLGLTAQVEEIKTKTTGSSVGVTEDDIRFWREVQGVSYFLQAPSLFSPKICKNCDEPYVVSRLFVAYCSYSCIKESLRAQGITWTRDKDLEALVMDPHVYDGKEPLWVSKQTLEKLKDILQEMDNRGSLPSQSLLPPMKDTPEPEVTSMSNPAEVLQSLLSAHTTTSQKKRTAATPRRTSSAKNSVKPANISFS